MAASLVVLDNRIIELRRLYDTAEGADMTIVCGNLTKEVHSYVLQLGSKALGTMCSGGFQEGVTKRIELKEHDPFLIGRMLQHLYAHEYSGSQESSGGVTETSFISELHTHVKMYALADEYDIKDLKIEASRNFTAAMVDKEGQGDDVTAVLKVIPAIYTTTPDSDRGLRDFAVEFCAQHLERMKDLPELEDVVFQAPKFMVEVLPLFFSKFQQKLSPVWEHCRRCGDTEGCVKYTRVSCDRCGYERILSTGERMAAFK